MDQLERKDYSSIIENMQDGYSEIDLAGTFTFANQAACDIFGYSRDRIIGVNYKEYTDEANARKAFLTFNHIYSTGSSGKLIDYEVSRPDGTKRLVELSVQLIRDRSGEPVGFRGTVRDVTERRKMEEKLRQSEKRYRTIIEDMSDPYFELDLRGRFTFANDALCKGIGYPREELMGMSNRQYADKKTIREMDELFGRVYKTGVPVRAHVFELIPRSGVKAYYEISISLIRNKRGRPVGFRGIARDITERKQYEEQIRHMATHDILTGLPNRIMFNELLQQHIDYACRYGQQFALLFMDLDGFKIINDTFGHEAGDQMLIVCATRLTLSLRASDFIARLGGDEFVILVKNVTSIKNLTTLVNKILSTVREPILIKGREYCFTASIGISMYPRDGRDKQSLTRSADLAMYSAKEKGSNNYQFFSAAAKIRSQESNMLEEQLRFALERDEFYLEYLPKFDLKSGGLAGVEALLRWRNPQLGQVAPMRFIPVADSTGLILPIGEWVLKTACLQNMAWQQRGLPGIRMAVNLSHRQLTDDRLIYGIRSALSESGMAAELLELEITENLLITCFPRIMEVINRLKKLGVRLALDGLGTGYSTLAQIRHLPVDTLKIDRSIINNIPVNSIDMAVARAIAGIGNALRLSVVAEGIETEEQLAFSKNSCCDVAQGFYFSRALSPDRVAELLSKAAPSAPDKDK